MSMSESQYLIWKTLKKVDRQYKLAKWCTSVFEYISFLMALTHFTEFQLKLKWKISFWQHLFTLFSRLYGALDYKATVRF